MLKRMTAAFLAILMLLLPVAFAEEVEDDGFDAEFADEDFDSEFEGEIEISGDEIWIVPEDGGLTWDESSMTIALPEDPKTGYAWIAEMDDGAVIAAGAESTQPAEDGALPVHIFTYAPAGDGETQVTLYYENQSGEGTAATLSYIITVEGGKFTDVYYEDLSDWDTEGDEEGGVLYEGDTGGVPLYLPEDMSVVSEEDGMVRLENEDKTIWMIIQYDMDGDAEALLAEFEDEEALATEYNDEAKGYNFISASVDMESDPPCGILVYEAEIDGADTIVEYTGYQAPNGGVLMVTTGYLIQ
jgi:predicted secreted protein